MRKKQIRMTKSITLYIVLLILGLINIFAIIWVVLTSIKPLNLTFKIPPALIFSPTIGNYQELFSNSNASIGVDVFKTVRNSVTVTLISTLVTMVLGCFAAFSLVNFRFRFRGTISFAILITRMLPPIGTIIPFFLFFNSLKLLDTQLALIMAYTAINLPLTVWMLRGFMTDIPLSLVEAARIDGCSYFNLLWRIYLPVVKPGLVASSVYSFLLSWNDFSIALVLTQANTKTIPLLAASFITEEGIMWGPMSSAITISIIPPVLFVILTHKGLAKGLTFGAVKE
jgi:multiple sugar transport system permease protein